MKANSMDLCLLYYTCFLFEDRFEIFITVLLSELALLKGKILC